MNFCTLDLGAVAVLGTGATTIGTGLAQPPASGQHRCAVACPLQWVPVIVAGAPPPTLRRRLANAFPSKDALQPAVWEYDANATDAIATYGPIADWNVSALTDMSALFSGLQNFNADISNWDTSRVTSMADMFRFASAFNQPLSLDTSNVTDMAYMFYFASAFDQPLILDTSRVTDMIEIFTVRLARALTPRLHMLAGPAHRLHRWLYTYTARLPALLSPPTPFFPLAGRILVVRCEQAADPLRVGRHFGFRLCWV